MLYLDAVGLDAVGLDAVGLDAVDLDALLSWFRCSTQMLHELALLLALEHAPS